MTLPTRRGGRRWLLAVLVAGGLVVASAPSANPAEGATSIVQIVTVGDIADNGGQQMRTAAMAQSFTPDRVLALGDNAYDSGTIGEFRTRWAPSWGRFDAIAWTVPGNHEYLTPNAAGYREYFGIAGDTWWARRAGAWLVIGLDSEVASNSRQLTFLRNTLAANNGVPTVVAWHRPRYSTGEHGNDASVDGLWRTAAADRDVRIALWGHDHDYERMAIPFAGRTTPVQAFVIGTGGVELRPFAVSRSTYTRYRIAGKYGFLDLRLRSDGWSWRFVTADGTRFDLGSRPL